MEKIKKSSYLGLLGQNPEKTGGYFSRAKNFLYSSEIEGTAIKELLGDVSGRVLPLARQYRNRDVSEKEKSHGRLKHISNELKEYGHYLKTHPIDAIIDTLAIVNGAIAGSTISVLSNPEILGELRYKGKIWNDVSFCPPSQGSTQNGMDYHQTGNRDPNIWDNICFATIPLEFVLIGLEGVKYYKYRKKSKQQD
jgi:hypothetical protein